MRGPLSDTRRITIHGVAGQPRPRLLFSTPNQDGLRLEFGSTLRYVEIDQTAANGNALFTANGVTVDQVIAKAPGIGDPAANVQNSTIRNSIVVASATNGRALVTDVRRRRVNTSTYRNVTAIATASGGVAIEASASNVTGKATIHLVNVLARAPSGISLRAQHRQLRSHRPRSPPPITNYQSGLWQGAGAGFVDGGGNPQEEPVFVNPAAGDYRQAAAALWTIDAGLDAAANGEFDVDGDPRQIGKTDIGADEFVPPPAATTPADADGARESADAQLRRSEADLDQAHPGRPVHPGQAELSRRDGWSLQRPHEAHRPPPAHGLARRDPRRRSAGPASRSRRGSGRP